MNQQGGKKENDLEGILMNPTSNGAVYSNSNKISLVESITRYDLGKFALGNLRPDAWDIPSRLQYECRTLKHPKKPIISYFGKLTDNFLSLIEEFQKTKGIAQTYYESRAILREMAYGLSHGGYKGDEYDDYRIQAIQKSLIRYVSEMDAICISGILRELPSKKDNDISNLVPQTNDMGGLLSAKKRIYEYIQSNLELAKTDPEKKFICPILWKVYVFLNANYKSDEDISGGANYPLEIAAGNGHPASNHRMLPLKVQAYERDQRYVFGIVPENEKFSLFVHNKGTRKAAKSTLRDAEEALRAYSENLNK